MKEGMMRIQIADAEEGKKLAGFENAIHLADNST